LTAAEIRLIIRPTVGLLLKGRPAMARKVHEEKYTVKRQEIIDAAQRLVYAKGYDQMSIQDILDELKISKGAFYHYFDSKGDLLEALIDRMRLDVEPIILPIVNDPALPTLTKIHRLFDTVGRWKTARKEHLISLLRAWYADENAIVRQKSAASVFKWFTPLLAGVIRQGTQDGVLTTAFPDQAAEIVLSVLWSLGETFKDLIFGSEPPEEKKQQAARVVAAYNDAMERMLGAPPGSLNLIDADTLNEWFVNP
jgi:AcrR family transcriptional regulator